jgi:hypothetical protein
MSKISFGATVTLAQAAQLIAASPNVRFFLQGEPGIGKSSILPQVVKLLNDKTGKGYVGSYNDVGTLDIGDTAMPAMDHENRVTRYYPSARFRLHEGKPVVIMLDEFTKGFDPVKNMLHPLLEISNPRLGDMPLPDGTVVFLTGNLASDGVGDTLKAHSRNRITTIQVRKPDSEEWLAWAVGSERVDPIVMAWVRQFPHALASYLDPSQSDNPYIYNPKKVQTAFVTPRSLEIASNIVSKRDSTDREAMLAALAGTIGEAAARDMQAYIAYQDQLPSWDSIIDKPDTTRIPDSAGACAVLVFGAVSKLTKENITPIMTYLGRFDAEWQACFAINTASNANKQSIAFSSKAFTDWVQRNEDIL